VHSSPRHSYSKSPHTIPPIAPVPGYNFLHPLTKDPFIALLALPGDDIKSENFVAFYFDGSFGVQIHANIWHQPVYPINNKAIFLGKQGAVHACVCIDTVDEWGKYQTV
jgi:ureidoglycolate hydrolase